MPVKVRCRGCQKVLSAPDKARGKVIKCPQCGEKIKVPEADAGAAGQKTTKAGRPSAPTEGEDFLSGLKLEQLEAEHAEEKVCPYCAADMPDPEDPVCHHCGMNTVTGQMDPKEARKRARKGPDPALFYKEVWGNSWEYVQRYWRLGLRTALIWSVFLTVSLSCVFYLRLIVFAPESAAAPAVHVAPGEEPPPPPNPYQSPIFFFFVGMAVIFFVGLPGWFWALSLKIIDATMSKEELKEDRVEYDMYESIALGFRLVFWPAVVMLPTLPVFAGLAVPLGGMELVQGTSTQPGLGVILLIVGYFVLPYLFFPQALVHMSVRHRFKAWILWEQLLIFFKNAPATLYWWVVACCVFLPAIVIVVLVGINAGPFTEWCYTQLDAAGGWLFGFLIDVGTPEDRPLFFKVLFFGLIPLLVSLAAVPFGFLIAYPSLFMMRATGLYGVYRRETLQLVTHVQAGQLAGFWVRFLTHTVDTAIITGFLAIMYAVPRGLVAAKFPLGVYFGGMLMPAINVGFVAIAGSKNARVSMGSLLLGVVSGMTFIYSENIPLFALLQTYFPLLMGLYNEWMYYSVNEASTSRSTIGKESFGLIVQTAEKGAELTLGQASLRHLGRLLSEILLGLPFLVAGFHPKKQALHDLMAKSVVVFRGDK